MSAFHYDGDDIAVDGESKTMERIVEKRKSQTIRELESEKTDLVAKLGDREEAVQDYYNKLTDYEDDIEDLKERLERKENELDRLRASKKDDAIAEAEIERLKQELAELQATYEAEQYAHRDTRAKLDRAAKELHNISDDLEKACAAKYKAMEQRDKAVIAHQAKELELVNVQHERDLLLHENDEQHTEAIFLEDLKDDLKEILNIDINGKDRGQIAKLLGEVIEHRRDVSREQSPESIMNAIHPRKVRSRDTRLTSLGIELERAAASEHEDGAEGNTAAFHDDYDNASSRSFDSQDDDDASSLTSESTTSRPMTPRRPPPTRSYSLKIPKSPSQSGHGSTRFSGDDEPEISWDVHHNIATIAAPAPPPEPIMPVLPQHLKISPAKTVADAEPVAAAEIGREISVSAPLTIHTAVIAEKISPVAATVQVVEVKAPAPATVTETPVSGVMTSTPVMLTELLRRHWLTILLIMLLVTASMQRALTSARREWMAANEGEPFVPVVFRGQPLGYLGDLANRASYFAEDWAGVKRGNYG